MHGEPTSAATRNFVHVSPVDPYSSYRFKIAPGALRSPYQYSDLTYKEMQKCIMEQ